MYKNIGIGILKTETCICRGMLDCENFWVLLPIITPPPTAPTPPTPPTPDECPVLEAAPSPSATEAKIDYFVHYNDRNMKFILEEFLFVFYMSF